MIELRSVLSVGHWGFSSTR